MRSDWIHVEPGWEGNKALAQLLLSLAHDPSHVRTMGGVEGFLVPPYLAELYTTPPKPRRRTKKEEVTDDGS